MRKLLLGLVAAALTAAAASAQSMPVSTFLAKADALESKGPLALMSSDLALLKREAQAAGKSLKEERLAAVAAGRKPAYCPPANASTDSDELLAEMRAIPAAERPRTDVRSALKRLLVKKYPCPAS
jgi:hypothetical protein